MKKTILCGLCILTAGYTLTTSMPVRAAELVLPAAQEETGETQELLTAGAGELFAVSLTEDEYKRIARNAEGARWGYTDLGICNVQENNLNIRKEPDEGSKLVGKLPKNAACEIVSSENGWAYIKSGKVEGYVKEEYLLSGFGAEQKGREVAKTFAVSSANALNIREMPSLDAEIVTQVAQGEALEVAEFLDNGWIKVYLDDEEVFVSGDFVEVKSDLPTAITMTELLYGQGVSGQSLCLGRGQSDKRSRLFRIRAQRFCQVRRESSPFLESAGEQRDKHQLFGACSRRSGVLCKGGNH